MFTLLTAFTKHYSPTAQHWQLHNDTATHARTHLCHDVYFTDCFHKTLLSHSPALAIAQPHMQELIYVMSTLLLLSQNTTLPQPSTGNCIMIQPHMQELTCVMMFTLLTAFTKHYSPTAQHWQLHNDTATHARTHCHDVYFTDCTTLPQPSTGNCIMIQPHMQEIYVMSTLLTAFTKHYSPTAQHWQLHNDTATHARTHLCHDVYFTDCFHKTLLSHSPALAIA